jgi:ubiquinone/menaquinone biosynthesis C-methylase UbiE
MENYDIVKADFNEIAELGSDPKWNHNNCYFPYLLRQIPSEAETCLDIGCGKGELSKLLSERVNKVIAVDFADKMIEYARSNNAARCQSAAETVLAVFSYLGKDLKMISQKRRPVKSSLHARRTFN